MSRFSVLIQSQVFVAKLLYQTVSIYKYLRLAFYFYIFFKGYAALGERFPRWLIRKFMTVDNILFLPAL